eukprot:352575-Chlamydomonas_euryale.AAC.5
MEVCAGSTSRSAVTTRDERTPPQPMPPPRAAAITMRRNKRMSSRFAAENLATAAKPASCAGALSRACRGASCRHRYLEGGRGSHTPTPRSAGVAKSEGDRIFADRPTATRCASSLLKCDRAAL